MSRIETLVSKVRALYEQKNPERDEWSDWLYENHVFVVAEYAEELAKRFDAPVDQCMAAAVLHDIADVQMSRFNPKHEEESLNIARRLLKESDYSDEEISTIVDDAIELHSCHDGVKPKTIVGKVLSTADALGHLKTDFYYHTTQVLMKDRPKAKVKKWAKKKLPRDYYDKIAFDEVREETKYQFNKLASYFGISS